MKTPILTPLLSKFAVDCNDAGLIEAELLKMLSGSDQLQRIRCVSADVTSINGGRATTVTRVYQETRDDN